MSFRPVFSVRNTSHLLTPNTVTIKYLGDPDAESRAVFFIRRAICVCAHATLMRSLQLVAIPRQLIHFPTNIKNTHFQGRSRDARHHTTAHVQSVHRHTFCTVVRICSIKNAVVMTHLRRRQAQINYFLYIAHSHVRVHHTHRLRSTCTCRVKKEWSKSHVV